MSKKGKRYHIPVDVPEDEGDAPETEATTAAETPGEGVPTAAAGNDAPVDKTYEDAIDHLRRLQAEFSNYKKRVSRERLETVDWAQGNLIQLLLPVLDDFDRALASLDDDASPEVKGMLLIREKLNQVLTEAGMERIEAEGQPFDPDVHEALMTQPVEPERAGTVVMDLVPGFKFKGRLVRPSRVQVGVESEDN